VSRGRNVFLVVCEAPDAAECLRALEPWAWQDLYAWLPRNYEQSGISGEVLGMMLVEGAARYARGLEVPATLAEEEGGKI
jgi:hypothetical protein